jgi:ABC-type multidrug transport system ATPase subunit/ABC-type multidrug transport system permease subunit
MKRVWLIGSGVDCDVVVDDRRVSARHCQLALSSEGLTLSDLNSTNGTFVGGQRITSPVRVTRHDEILLAGCVPFPWPKQSTTAAKPQSPTSTPSAEHEETLLIGREDTCGLVIDRPSVSREHARLVKRGEFLYIEDLHAANGTFLNGQRIAGRVPVRAGDLLGIGDYELEVQTDGQLRPPATLYGVAIEVRNVTVDVPGRRLLEDVSLSVFPGEFVGLMGPSGVGKTTLLNVMDGYTLPSTGMVMVNGIDLYSHYAQFSNAFGYVPQDDIMHRELTVAEALYYTARLRLPDATSDDEIRARVERVVARLGLRSTVDTVIGSPEVKGISGGERKRVNLALELLTDPAVMFLDEPTSGLSSEDALAVMRLLRDLADQGKTIVLTVHQPSLEAFRLLDRLIVVSRDAQSAEPGRVAYFGPAYPDAIHFFNPERFAKAPSGFEPNPDDLLRGLSQQPTRQWIDRFRESSYYKAFVTARSNRLPPQLRPLPPRPPASAIGQWCTLVRRGTSILLRDRWKTLVLLAQAPIVAVIVLMVFAQSVSRNVTSETWNQVANASAATLFLLGLSALWFGCSNAVREIVGEWAVYRRERMVDLRIAPYIASKLAIGFGLCAVQCVVLLVIARWGCGLHGPAISCLGVMMLAAGTGLAIGLLISALARSSEVAIAIMPLVLIPMVVLGGVLLPVHKMQLPIRTLAYLMPTRAGFEAMMTQEANRRPLGPSPYTGGSANEAESTNVGRPDMAEIYFPKNTRIATSADVAILIVMFSTLIVLVYVALRARDLPSRSLSGKMTIDGRATLRHSPL